MLELLKVPFLVQYFSYYTLIIFLMLSHIAIYADDTAHSFKFYQASDL